MYFLVHGKSFAHNSPLFWARGGNGYTQWIDDAEVFTEVEADEIIKSTKSSHDFKKMLISDIVGIAKRTVDMQDYHKLKAEIEEAE